jgi:hypothetical protein
MREFNVASVVVPDGIEPAEIKRIREPTMSASRCSRATSTPVSKAEKIRDRHQEAERDDAADDREEARAGDFRLKERLARVRHGGMAGDAAARS